MKFILLGLVVDFINFYGICENLVKKLKDILVGDWF